MLPTASRPATSSCQVAGSSQRRASGEEQGKGWPSDTACSLRLPAVVTTVGCCGLALLRGRRDGWTGGRAGGGQPTQLPGPLSNPQAAQRRAPQTHAPQSRVPKPPSEGPHLTVSVHVKRTPVESVPLNPKVAVALEVVLPSATEVSPQATAGRAHVPVRVHSGSGAANPEQPGAAVLGSQHCQQATHFAAHLWACPHPLQRSGLRWCPVPPAQEGSPQTDRRLYAQHAPLAGKPPYINTSCP